MKDFEIWTEGYSFNGGDHGIAQFICKSKGNTFREACINAYKAGLFKNWGNFNEEHLTLWGCGLYSNEQDARKSFG